MSERKISRKNGKPVAFATQSIQFVRIGKKKEPQMYTPSCKIHKGRCKKLRHH